MHGIISNSAISNLQVRHDMSKMNEIGSNDQMKTNCNMRQMHGDSTVSSFVKSDTSSKAVNSNLGGNLDIQV